MRSIFLNDEPAAPVELDTRESAASVNAMHGLLLVVTLIVVFGLTMLYSASYNTDGLKYFRNQIIWAAHGRPGRGRRLSSSATASSRRGVSS